MVRDLAVLESLNQQVLDALPSGILFCDTDYIVREIMPAMRLYLVVKFRASWGGH